MSILLTRPAGLNARLAKKLSAKGYCTLSFPTMKIMPAHDMASLYSAVDYLQEGESSPGLIFTSPSCVQALFARFPALAISRYQLFALGKGTAKALSEFTQQLIVYPTTANSESLLALPELIGNEAQSFIIFCGEDPRPILAEQLQARGASVHMAYTHRRVMADHTDIAWEAADIELTICTSLQSLQNLRTMIEQLNILGLLQKPLMVITAKMAKEAEKMGFKSAIIQAAGASDANLLAALNDYQQRMPHD